LVALIWLRATAALGDTWSYGFDASGNLASEAVESPALPQILAQPQQQIAGPGELASFFVVAADTRGLTYQWRFYGTNLPGATADTLLVTNVSAGMEGPYSVVLANGSGSVTSSPAMLWYDGNGNGMPDSWELAYFGNLNQTATGDYDGDGVSNLQEFLDGTNPTNSASALLQLSVGNDAGLVTVTPAQRSYTNGQTVTLTASPANTFHAWTGALYSRANPLTLTITSNTTLVARFTPIAFTWTSPTGGDWNTATNWTPALVPGTNDNVFITSAVTVTASNSIECASLTLGAPGIAPTLSITGDLLLDAASYWFAGTMSGSGRTVVNPAATLTISNSSTVVLSARTLENDGTVLWVGANDISATTAVITNGPGALFVAQNSASFSGSGSRFDNAGTFRKAASTGTTTFSTGAPLNNYGTVDIQTGALVLAGGSTNAGAFTLATNTTLNLSGNFGSGAASSITGAGNLTVSGGTATLAGLVNLTGTHLFSGGTANLTGNYVCTNNTLNISGGTANFDGTGTVAPALVNLSAGALGGGSVVTVGSQMSWTGGDMGGSGKTLISGGATLTVASQFTLNLSRGTLENAGTVVWTGAGFYMTGAVITNRAGALFDTQNASPFGWISGTPRFDNAGIFRKELSAGITKFNNGVAFNNYGTVDLRTGTLLCSSSFLNNGAVNLSAGTTAQFASGGSANGAFSAPATAQVQWSGGTFTLNPGAQLNDIGSYVVNGGTLLLNTDITLNHLDLSSTLDGPGALTVTNLMNWTGGTMTGTGRTLIAPGASLNVASQFTLNLSRATLENAGTVVWTGAGFYLTGTVITNRAGALFDAQNGSPFGWTSGSPRFDNAGTFRKELSSGTTTFNNGVALNNYGTLDIQAGTLSCGSGFLNNGTLSLSAGTAAQFPSGGTSAGPFTAANTAQVQWSGGTFTLNPGAQLNGPGSYLVNGGTLLLNTDVTVSHLDLSSTLDGSGALTVTNLMNWTGGTMMGTGRTLITPGANLNVASQFTLNLSRGTLENAGTVVWTGAGFYLTGTVITNRAGALFDAQNATAFNNQGNSPRFDNAGTFRKELSSGTTSFTSGVPLNNYGILDIRTGIISAGGGCTFGSGALLSCSLGGTAAGSGYGQLQVSGTANLNGSLSVNLTNGFVPAVSNSFTVLTAGARASSFASFNYPSNRVTMQLSNAPASVILTVTGVAPPPPLLLSPSISGSNLVLTWTAVSNLTYRVEYNPNLTPSNWSAVPGDVTSLSNLASKLEALTSSNRFYRVRALP
jgi:hypothetical protein